MQAPTFTGSRRLDAQTTVFESYAPLPGLGVLPVNAYLVHAREPVLIDTGMATLHDDFMRALKEQIDPSDLRWIWLTHADADHLGNLRAVLAAAPQARIVTNYLGVGKLGLQQFPVERTWMLNPGQALDAGDRELLAFRPPVFDAPETMGLFDSRSRFAFTSDSFGAVLARPYESAAQVPSEALRDGMVLWAGIDAPWLPNVHARGWAEMQQPLRSMAPRMLLSSHLPPAVGMDGPLYQGLAAAREATPFVGPDQAALMAAATPTNEPAMA
jgi:flavorubredoxin